MKRRRILALGAALAAFFVLAVAGSVSLARGDSGAGTFVIRCDFSHARAADPIVAPGVYPSAHLHVFQGNTDTDENSTEASQRANGQTTCRDKDDTAAYWEPALVDGSGNLIAPLASFAYYKNLPVNSQTTKAPPAGLKMVFGPAGSSWDCFNTGQASTTAIPDCSAGGSGNYTVTKLKSLPCWDGVHIDSIDHRSHMSDVVNGLCPSGHPVKIDLINLFFRYPSNVLDTHSDVHFSDRGQNGSNGVLPHADYWNTWFQPALEALQTRCIAPGINCGQVTG